jgi:hypothetical protein
MRKSNEALCKAAPATRRDFRIYSGKFVHSIQLTACLASHKIPS